MSKINDNEILRRVKGMPFRAKVGWGVFGLLAVAFVFGLLLRNGNGSDTHSSLTEERAVAAFKEWREANGGKGNLKSVRLYRSVIDESYGRSHCPDYEQMVEFQLLTDDLADFIDKSYERRRWGYNQERKLLDEYLAKPDKNGNDSLMIARGFLRQEWLGRYLDKRISPEARQEVLLTRQAAHERVDSVNAIAKMLYEFDITPRKGEPLRVVFSSPVDSMVLSLEYIYSPKSVDIK